MQELHSALRQHHHLRHWGRMQYGLFLKGIGLSLEGALQFWRSELSRIMDGDKVNIHFVNLGKIYFEYEPDIVNFIL